MGKTKGLLVLLLSQCVLLVSCTSQQDKWEKQLYQQSLVSQTKIERLKKHIASGHIQNVVLLKRYAEIVADSNPEVASLAGALAMDATPNGPIIQSLESRLSDAKSDIPKATSYGYKVVNKVYQELSSIETAASPDNYGLALSDPINVLADMSEGKLARVDSLSRDASARLNNAEDFGTGSQLVGNPNYGSWQTQSSGGSFWQWYGQYAFFSSMFHRSIYYSNWGRHRDYSYYNDYGRSVYTSPSQRSRQESVQRRTKDKFQRSGKSFRSPYAQSKFTSSKMTRSQSRFKPKSMTRYAPKSTTSSYRSSSYQSSRSSFGGK